VGHTPRDLAECLSLQLAERDRLDPAMAALLDNLDLLARRDMAQLTALCGVDAEDIADMIVEIRGLNVFYGRSHALQGVDLTLDSGVLSVVGRNGMGKTTLCKTIMGLVRATGGSVRMGGEDLLSLQPAQIARLGVGYVPQGRRLWRSLTVDEHLRMTAGIRRGAWTVERIYDTFPRLAERKNNGGGQLSGGEQQMLAISRALVTNPRPVTDKDIDAILDAVI